MEKELFIDRKDATRVRNLTGLNQICIDLKPHRCDSDVYINQKFDVTEIVKYMEKNKDKDLTYFHIFVAAMGKMLYLRENLNCFVANRHLYKHDEVVISFVAKTSFDDKSEEMMILIPIKENDNLFTISDRIKTKVADIRDKKVSKQGANDIIDTVGKLPNIIRVPFVGFFKYFDKLGLLPQSFIKDNIYYSSLIVSNLGSIDCGAIYHNLANFGTCSSLATIGKVTKEKTKYFCEFGINLDERIADGFYMVKSMHLLQEIFNNPKLLEDDINKEI